MRSTARGASSAAFRTMLFPAQMAGAIFREASWAGAFQGTMAPTPPKGLTSGVAEDGFAQRDSCAFELACEATEVAERVYDPLGFAARLCAEGVPGLARDQTRQFLQSGLQGFGDGQKRPPALPGRGMRPCRECRGGGLDCQVDVLRLRTRDLANRLTPCRVLDHEGLPRKGIPPFASDQHLSREVGR